RKFKNQPFPKNSQHSQDPVSPLWTLPSPTAAIPTSFGDTIINNWRRRLKDVGKTTGSRFLNRGFRLFVVLSWNQKEEADYLEVQLFAFPSSSSCTDSK